MSGNEGELKKRIGAKYWLTTTRDGKGLLTEPAVFEQDVWDILDEAKKDFPKLDDVYDYSEESRKKGIEKLYEQEKWFMKWFGGAKK